MIKTIERNEQLSCQNKLDSLSALCSMEIALEILRKALRKDTTDEFHIYRNTFLNGSMLLQKLFLTCIIMIKINVIFVHGIELSRFTEKLREIGEGPKFALSVLTRTAS